MLFTQIPSPNPQYTHIGPVHFYALAILTGVFVAIYWSRKRYAARGGDPELIYDLALVAVPFGIIGARLYHVATAWDQYFGPGRNPWNALKIWNGGLGIWGAIVAGCLAGYVLVRRRKLYATPILDSIAPTLLVAQAIGRLGNYFNQELYGQPTSLPWGLHIDPPYRAVGYEQFATFHPTFLYELLWNLAMAALLVYIDRNFKLRGGQLFALYVAFYTLGRAWIEALRIDTSYYVLGVRLNVWMAILLFMLAVAGFVWLGKQNYSTVQPPVPGESDNDEAADGAADGSGSTDSAAEIPAAPDTASAGASDMASAIDEPKLKQRPTRNPDRGL